MCFPLLHVYLLPFLYTHRFTFFRFPFCIFLSTLVKTYTHKHPSHRFEVCKAYAVSVVYGQQNIFMSINLWASSDRLWTAFRADTAGQCVAQTWPCVSGHCSRQLLCAACSFAKINLWPIQFAQSFTSCFYFAIQVLFVNFFVRLLVSFVETPDKLAELNKQVAVPTSSAAERRLSPKCLNRKAVRQTR